MSNTWNEPCPGELVNPSEDVTSCVDEEFLVKFVELWSLLRADEQGQYYLLATAISREDLKEALRSVSTLRHPLTPAVEIARRGLRINKEPQWAEDPLAAVASVASLRLIADKAGRREICVFAEPTTEDEDKFGACATHAGLKRSCNPSSLESRLDWAVLRGQVAAHFNKFIHICSCSREVKAL